MLWTIEVVLAWSSSQCCPALVEGAAAMTLPASVSHLATREVLRKIFGQFLYFVHIHNALRLLDLGFASVVCATSVALARVLTFATVLSFRIVRHSLEGNTCFGFYFRGIGANGQFPK
jgi:hypothetical protein